MQKDLTDYRKSYEKGKLLEADIPNNPFKLFQSWFNLADEAASVEEANAMSVSTVSYNMFPKTRVVLLKGFSEEGFMFFTNYESEKGKAIKENPKCCLSFFWPSLEKQVIIQGEAIKVSREESQKYFHSRPRGSQLSANVSNQSAVIPSRKFLEEKLQNLEKEYEGKEVPVPDYWGGYIVKPLMIEFWQGRKSRLHDRILFTKLENKWKIERLAP